MASVLREFVVDCNDVDRVATFWSNVLGWPIVKDPRGFSWISSTGKEDAPPPLITFLPVPEPKTVKNRLHFDLNPSGCDQATELKRLLGLGARKIDIGQRDVSWIVLADPEGNEFCLLARRVD